MGYYVGRGNEQYSLSSNRIGSDQIRSDLSFSLSSSPSAFGDGVFGVGCSSRTLRHPDRKEEGGGGGKVEEEGMEWEREMERERKKRTKKKKKGKEGSRDPLEVFGMDLMLRILMKLDALSVALSSLVSRRWHLVASSDPLWSLKCEELWSGKAHIPRMSQVVGLSKFAAYSLSVIDGKRTRITKYDLSDHAWEFHFSKAAPVYWRNLDPYWKGTGRLMHRYFHLDGSQSADPGDKVWGGHECCYCTVTSSLEDGKIREHYVRINRWPRLCVSRKQDWSWEMNNHLCCYSSIPDADKPGGTGPLFPVM